MSMLGISFLNDIISVEEVESPAIILDKLSNRLINELRQTDETIGNKDGMDISLCCLNTQTRELQWAGANNSLILIQNNTLIEIKPDKQPIGYYVNHKLFTNHLIQLQKNDCIYIYSDGYADQFGGEKGKKFKYKKLEERIKQMSTLPMAEQKKLLKQQFDLWKGALEQVDDVCVLGVRV
ncbi:MAG: SpoIIE family protein phosphatase [Bacteroidia bacterium]